MHIQTNVYSTRLSRVHTPVINWAVVLDGLKLVVTLLAVNEREEGVVALHPPIGSLKKLLWVGAGTEIRTQYLLADDTHTAPSGPVCEMSYLSNFFMFVARAADVKSNYLKTSAL